MRAVFRGSPFLCHFAKDVLGDVTFQGIHLFKYSTRTRRFLKMNGSGWGLTLLALPDMVEGSRYIVDFTIF